MFISFFFTELFLQGSFCNKKFLNYLSPLKNNGNKDYDVFTLYIFNNIPVFCLNYDDFCP